MRAVTAENSKYSLAGVGLTSRRTTEEERHLTVGNGLLGQIIVDDDSVLSIVTEPFAYKFFSTRSGRRR